MRGEAMKKLYVVLASAMLMSAHFIGAYHRSFNNKTPYPLIVTIKRIAGGESTETINPDEKKTISHGIYAIDWVKVKADIPGKGFVEAVSEEKNIGAVSLDYLIFCQPKITSQQIAGGVRFITDKIRFFLFRYAAPARPGGIVAEGAWINL